MSCTRPCDLSARLRPAIDIDAVARSSLVKRPRPTVSSHDASANCVRAWNDGQGGADDPIAVDLGRFDAGFLTAGEWRKHNYDVNFDQFPAWGKGEVAGGVHPIANLGVCCGDVHHVGSASGTSQSQGERCEKRTPELSRHEVSFRVLRLREQMCLRGIRCDAGFAFTGMPRLASVPVGQRLR